ncbi:hypothetical protein ACUSIJ_06630 [Pseudochelatococcus sp. B33]
MTDNAFNIPPAAEFAKRAADKRAEEEARRRHLHETGDTQREELVASLLKPKEVVVEEALRRVSVLVRTASEHGLNEVLTGRFPSETLADHGRAILAGDPEWPETLQGQPRVLYELWRDHLKPLGYGLRVEIINYRNDLPGDVGSFLFWGVDIS